MLPKEFQDMKALRTPAAGFIEILHSAGPDTYRVYCGPMLLPVTCQRQAAGCTIEQPKQLLLHGASLGPHQPLNGDIRSGLAACTFVGMHSAWRPDPTRLLR